MNIPIYSKHSYEYSNKQTNFQKFKKTAAIITLKHHVNAKCKSSGITKRNK